MSCCSMHTCLPNIGSRHSIWPPTYYLLPLINPPCFTVLPRVNHNALTYEFLGAYATLTSRTHINLPLVPPYVPFLATIPNTKSFDDFISNPRKSFSRDMLSLTRPCPSLAPCPHHSPHPRSNRLLFTRSRTRLSLPSATLLLWPIRLPWPDNPSLISNDPNTTPFYFSIFVSKLQIDPLYAPSL